MYLKSVNEKRYFSPILDSTTRLIPSKFEVSENPDTSDELEYPTVKQSGHKPVMRINPNPGIYGLPELKYNKNVFLQRPPSSQPGYQGLEFQLS